jgi:hypothetical protein
MVSTHLFLHLSRVENDWSDKMNPGRRDARQAILRGNLSCHPAQLIELASKRHQELVEEYNEHANNRQEELFLRHQQTFEALLGASEPNSIIAQRRLVQTNQFPCLILLSNFGSNCTLVPDHKVF